MNNTILIVDDIMLNINILTDILGDSYTIMAAVSGENAIKLLERKKPDLVLLDIHMPGIDGFEVLRFMKSRKDLSNIPVIIVSGEQDTLVEAKGLTLGAVDYVKKPYNASIVGIKVKNHLELKAYRDDLEMLVRERTKQVVASRETIIMAMSLMSESHDKITGEHIDRIKRFTEILANKLAELYPDMLTLETAGEIALYSPLHDIGKIGISDTILKKNDFLTPDEFDIMKMHTLDGAELLRKAEQYLTNSGDAGGLSVAIEIAECHHERFDGTGYPRGLKGNEIPLSARIVALADVYDALRSARTYKRAFTHSEAVDIILKGDQKTGYKHFDPIVLEVFNVSQEEFEKVYQQQ